MIKTKPDTSIAAQAFTNSAGAPKTAYNIAEQNILLGALTQANTEILNNILKEKDILFEAKISNRGTFKSVHVQIHDNDLFSDPPFPVAELSWSFAGKIRMRLYGSEFDKRDIQNAAVDSIDQAMEKLGRHIREAIVIRYPALAHDLGPEGIFATPAPQAEPPAQAIEPYDTPRPQA